MKRYQYLWKKWWLGKYFHGKLAGAEKRVIVPAPAQKSGSGAVILVNADAYSHM